MLIKGVMSSKHLEIHGAPFCRFQGYKMSYAAFRLERFTKVSQFQGGKGKHPIG